MKIALRASFVSSDDRTFQEIWTHENSIILCGFSTLTRFDLVNDQFQLRWNDHTPKNKNISSQSLGDPSYILWSEGWSEIEKQNIIYLAAISFSQGTELWRYKVPQGTSSRVFGTKNSVILSKGMTLSVLNRESGTEQAQFSSPGAPIAYVKDQDESLIVEKEGNLWNIDLQTGKINWSCQIGTSIRNVIATKEQVYGITQNLKKEPKKNIDSRTRPLRQLKWLVWQPLTKNHSLLVQSNILLLVPIKRQNEVWLRVPA